ncbi:MAG: hypothetical protein A4E57_01219 [Syntrophorhabdaceae bacterium PtaU1.Bin034]|nr:MAG: hypothetical protein A4E57_01219 [Syntrophorhabdaceae bacterium PtaU1.Bin034]
MRFVCRLAFKDTNERYASRAVVMVAAKAGKNTTPAVVVQILNCFDNGPVERIEMNVPDKLKKIRLFFNEN